MAAIAVLNFNPSKSRLTFLIKWPVYDEAKTIEEEAEIAVQLNGKVRATIKVGINEEQDSVREKVMLY